MKSFSRVLEATIEREKADPATGEFSSILATSGEASDGHILDVRSLKVPASMPLLFGHRSEVLVPSLGSVKKPEKVNEGGIDKLRVRPQVNLEGDGMLPDIRRGMFGLIANGDLGAMSIRWDGEAVRRTELKPGHYAHIDTTGNDDPRRWGLFFKNARALEGSVVAIGADPKALIGRAQTAETDGERVFYSFLARSVEASEDQTGDVVAAFDALRAAVGSLEALAVESSDIASLIGVDGELDLVSYDYSDGAEARRIYLPRVAWESLRGESLREMRAALALCRGAEAPVALEPKQEATRQTHEPRRRTVADLSVDEYADLLGRSQGNALEAVLYRVLGKVG